ncbi:MAG: chloride channel protein [Candidatus Scalindua sp.]
MIKENKARIKIIHVAGKLKLFNDTFILVLAALVGLLLGFAGMFRPEIHGVGYGIIEGILNNPGQIGIIILALLCVLRIVMTSVTIGAGGSGGVFAPSLFMGAAIGGGIRNLCSGNFIF